MIENNPGQQVRNLLKELFPQEDNITSSSNKTFFISKMDDALIANGNFTKLIYDSTINYMLRRFINTAEYLRRKYQSDDFPADKFINELRKFIQESTLIEGNNSEKLLALLISCLEVRNRKLKSSRKKQVLKKAQLENELRCYICGKTLSINQPNALDEVQVEHIWPRSMGGASEDFNLAVACADCNKTKQNYIDASDFHYEKISVTCEKSEDSFSIQMEREYKIALWAKSGYSCTLCGKSASSVGRLNFSRINPNDSWHFLNIEAYCGEHTPE